MSWTRWSRRFAPKTVEADERPVSFVEFVNMVRPGFVWAPHLIVIAGVLQLLADRQLYHPKTGKLLMRVAIFMPPRHGKSELVSRLFTAYHAYRYPRRHIMLVCYGERLARTLSRSAREFYRKIGGTLDKAGRAAKNWLTPLGGGMWADSIHGALSGQGANLGVVDDPVKNAVESMSPAKHESMMDNYRSAFVTRLEADIIQSAGAADVFERRRFAPIEVVVLTRWPNDLMGEVLKEEQADCDDSGINAAEGWYIIDLPAIAEELSERPVYPPSCYVHPDWRKPGEALWPDRMDVSKLAKIRARIGEFFWMALFQQRPSIRSGDMFDMSKLQYIDAEKVPMGLPALRWWDRAATKNPVPGKQNGRSHTAGVRIEGPDANGFWYITDCVCGQWDPAERDAVIRRTAEDDGLAVQIVGAKDPGQAGKVEAAAFVANLAGFPVTVDVESGSKQTRAVPLASQWGAGKVFIVNRKRGKYNSWHSDAEEAFRGFPRGGIIDIVDAASNAFNKRTGASKGKPLYGGESRDLDKVA